MQADKRGPRASHGVRMHALAGHPVSGALPIAAEAGVPSLRRSL